jgi:Rho-type GTPase-activating protein 1/2
LPHPVRHVVLILSLGMDVEGIYRKAGGASQVQTVREGFEYSPETVELSDPDLDIHAVSSGLKQYFRRLPNPLITYDVYDKLLDTTNILNPEGKIDGMRRALMDLPKVHRDVLEFLVFHLKRVVEREPENLMTSMNIAVVFAPTIMRPESVTREMSDTQKKNEAVQFLVENCQAIFMAVH